MTTTLILGDFPTETDQSRGEIFSGSVGKELKTLLSLSGFSETSYVLANLFSTRPFKSDILSWCTGKRDAGAGYPYPPISRGKFLTRTLAAEALGRAKSLILETSPNLIIALGLSAAWATTGCTGISGFRGTVQACSLVPNKKVLPTYHPSTILRQWDLRPVLLADLGKAFRESQFPELRRPERELWLDPTLPDIEFFIKNFILPSSVLGVDIETAIGQVTHISFAPSPFHSICIPFLDPRFPGGSYWPDLETEVAVWNLVREVLKLPKRFIFQNGMYDIQWLWKQMGLTLGSGEYYDTMLAHHALYPEMEKSLGFLGSIYTDEGSWKLLRKPADGDKADE